MSYPHISFEADADLEKHEQIMISMGGYKPDVHWSKGEQKALRATNEFSEKIQALRKHHPFPFHLYFYHIPKRNYNEFLQYGRASDKLIKTKFSKNAARNIISARPDKIVIVLTNNLSDVSWIPITSPWILAHRIAHAIDNSQISVLVSEYIKTIAIKGYDVQWPGDDGSELDYYQNIEFHEAYHKTIGHAIGTMRSARQQKLVNPADLGCELFAQWLITGKVTLNPLPEILWEKEGDDYIERLTGDPARRRRVQAIHEGFPRVLETKFQSILTKGIGKIFIV